MSLSNPGCQGHFNLQKLLFHLFARLESNEKEKCMVTNCMKMFVKLERGREEQAELQAAVLPVSFCFPRSLSKSLSPGDDV